MIPREKNQPVSFDPERFRAFIVTLLLTLTLLACTLGETATPPPIAPATLVPTVTATPPPTSTPTPTFTLTPTATHTPAVTSTPTRTATAVKPTEVASCPGAPAIRLKLDRLAQVSIDPPVANRIRIEPGTSSEMIGLVGAGEIVLIDEGPQCADGYTWWHIQSFNGLQGWTAEGDAAGYWLLPLTPEIPAGEEDVNRVTLTAEQVSSAPDIEAAIKRATVNGTQPGTVILDGRNGPFVYSGDDQSLNIFVSNLTLLGVNQAKIENCGDGLFFDDFPLENILVEGIEFDCTGHGVSAGGTFQNVTLRGNIFRTVLVPISLGGDSSGWLIEQNLIETHSNGIEVTGATKIIIKNNYISGWEGIMLRQCSEFRVTKNMIHSFQWGIHILQESSNNLVEKNIIYYEQYSGIILVAGVKDNQILSNIVSCVLETGCLSVDARPDVAEVNTIIGNIP